MRFERLPDLRAVLFCLLSPKSREGIYAAMNISVFGGSQPKEASSAYLEAQALGDSLARAGHTVLTGGYIGTMEAVSRGAAEAGGHVIGVTCEDIERFRPIRANAWVKEEWRRKTLMERLEALIQHCDAALALPGGPGTLTEISLMWNLMVIEALQKRPLILIGTGWKSAFDQIFSSMTDYTGLPQQQLLKFAPDVKSALKMIDLK